jgi:hypothetical protein
LQERLEVLLAPSVVDDEKNAAVAERLAELRRRCVDRLQVRPLAGQEHNEIGKRHDEPLRLLAELGPKNPVEIGVLNVGVVGERPVDAASYRFQEFVVWNRIKVVG